MADEEEDKDMAEEPPPQTLMETIKAREVSDNADAQRDKYTVIREIGKGTFGVAYLVKNKVNEQPEPRESLFFAFFFPVVSIFSSHLMRPISCTRATNDERVLTSPLLLLTRPQTPLPSPPPLSRAPM